jgi:hypothetical protein
LGDPSPRPPNFDLDSMHDQFDRTGGTVLVADDLRRIESFKDAVSYLEDTGAISADQAAELSGFGLLPGKNKALLVGVPFVIVEFEFRIGRDNSSFVECAIVTTKNERYLMRDSSKGIFQQLKSLYEERLAAGHPHPTLAYYARKGLTFQDYNYVAPSGESTKSRTYFLV